MALESYGMGTGVAIGAVCFVAPLAAVFAALFAGNPDDKTVIRSFAVAGGLGLAAACAVAYYAPTVRSGILYGVLAGPAVIAVPAILDGLDRTVDGRLSKATIGGAS